MSVIFREDRIKVFKDDKTGDVSFQVYAEQVRYSEDLEENNPLLVSIKFTYWNWKELAKAIAFEEIQEYKEKLKNLIDKSDM